MEKGEVSSTFYGVLAGLISVTNATGSTKQARNYRVLGWAWSNLRRAPSDVIPISYQFLICSPCVFKKRMKSNGGFTATLLLLLAGIVTRF